MCTLQALDLTVGDCVLESGTGSGSMTHALARAVGPTGNVHTYDIDEKRTLQVRKQLQQHQADDVR